MSLTPKPHSFHCGPKILSDLGSGVLLAWQRPERGKPGPSAPSQESALRWLS